MRRAFTLVEMLVVAAIIGGLASAFVVLAAKARNTAEVDVFFSTMSGVQSSFNAYCMFADIPNASNTVTFTVDASAENMPFVMGSYQGALAMDMRKLYHQLYLAVYSKNASKMRYSPKHLITIDVSDTEISTLFSEKKPVYLVLGPSDTGVTFKLSSKSPYPKKD